MSRILTVCFVLLYLNLLRCITLYCGRPLQYRVAEHETLTVLIAMTMPIAPPTV